MQEYITVKGTKVPKVGFGTYRMEGEECVEPVKNALRYGYRHIDTAMAYGNEAEIGRAIQESDIDREDIFLTTKVKGYPEFLDYESFFEAVESCLQRLDTDYIDLLLIHWWVSQGDMEGVMRAMDELVDENMVRNIGVSNFSIQELKQARELADSPILTNQVEYHPYFADNQRKLLDYCQKEDILLTAYSPLAEGLVTSDETLTKIGTRYGKSAAQVAIRWTIQQDNVVTIPKSASQQHMVENFDVFDFELTDQEMRRITATRGPISYELTKEGGPVYRLRGAIGPHLPEPVRKSITSLGSAVLKFAP